MSMPMFTPIALPNQAKFILAMIAFTLCGLVGALLARLRARSQRLAEQLAFETAAGLAKVELANAEPDSFDNALRAALATFSAFFKAGVALQIVDQDRDGQERFTVTTNTLTRSAKPTRHNGLKFPRRAGDDETGVPAFVVTGEEIAECGQIAITTTMPGNSRMIAGCILTYPHAAPKLTEALKAQLHAALDVMTDALRLNLTRRDQVRTEQRLGAC